MKTCTACRGTGLQAFEYVCYQCGGTGRQPETIVAGSTIQTPVIGPGGAPTRATTFPDDAKGRKAHPVATGFLDYFPDAIVAIAAVSFAGNEQHNPGQPLHWARGKSGDEADAMMRHFLQRGTLDSDGKRHSAKAAWRILALLQKEIEEEQARAVPIRWYDANRTQDRGTP